MPVISAFEGLRGEQICDRLDRKTANRKPETGNPKGRKTMTDWKVKLQTPKSEKIPIIRPKQALSTDA